MASAATPVTASMRRTPGRDRCLRHDPEIADIAGTAHMGSAAEFDRPGGLVALGRAHRHHPHLVAVFLPEQCHRAGFHRRLRGHQPCRDLRVFADAGVHHRLDPGQFVGRDRARLRHVEAQPVGRVQAAFLRHVGAEFAPQRLMQQMRRGVMRADRRAPRMIDRGDDRGVDACHTGLDHAHDARTNQKVSFGYR